MPRTPTAALLLSADVIGLYAAACALRRQMVRMAAARVATPAALSVEALVTAIPDSSSILRPLVAAKAATFPIASEIFRVARAVARTPRISKVARL